MKIKIKGNKTIDVEKVISKMLGVEYALYEAYKKEQIIRYEKAKQKYEKWRRK